MLLRELLGLRTTGRDPDAPALIDPDGQAFSYAQLLSAAELSGWYLRGRGVAPGDRVVLCADDGLGTLVAILGAWALGAVPAPVSNQLPAADLALIADDCQARLVVVDRGRPLEPDAHGLDTISTTERFAQLLHESLTAGPRHPAGPDQAAGGPGRVHTGDPVVLIQYTSGSTGRPKGVRHRRSGLQAVIDTTGRLYALRPDDRVLSTSRLSFGYGFGNTVLFPWAAGAAGCLLSGTVDVFATIDAVTRLRPTVLTAVPRIWNGLAEAADLGREVDLSRLRLGVSAGEFLPPAVSRRVRERFGLDLIDGLGATEILHICLARRPGDSGLRPLPGTTVTLRDETGAVLAGRATGRLHIAGPMVAAGYHDRPDQTREVFADGGAYTGDICLRDASGGYEWMSRTDDLLLLGGHRVAPREIEEVVGRLDCVQECLVTPHTGRDGLQDAVLHVVPAPGRTGSVAARIRRELARALPAYKRPGLLRVVETLPRTATGKPARSVLRGSTDARSTSGLALRVLRPGDGRRVLIVPCAGGSSQAYEGTALSLAEGVEVASADQVQPLATRLDDLVDRWLVTVESYLRPGDLLVGHSFGAAVVTAISHVAPATVRDKVVVLACPPTGITLPRKDTELVRWMRENRLLPTPGISDDQLLRLIVPRFRRDADLLTQAPPGPPSWLPAQVIVADDDPVCPVDPLRRSLIGGASRLTAVAAADHFLPMSDPTLFARTLNDLAPSLCDAAS